MKIKVSNKIIAGLKPCTDRWKNFVLHYPNFKGDITEFLDLKYITVQDKIWVIKQLVPTELIVVFSIDCVFSANASVAAADASSDCAAYAAEADCAAYAAEAAYAVNAAYTAYAANTAYAAEAAANAAEAAEAAAYVAEAAARNAERKRQIESLKYLIRGWRK